MKKFKYFLKCILPNIINVVPTDIGELYVYYLKDGVLQTTVMPLNDYEIAVAHSNKINGLMDRMAGLS